MLHIVFYLFFLFTCFIHVVVNVTVVCYVAPTLKIDDISMLLHSIFLFICVNPMIPKGMWPLVIGFPGLELLFQELNSGSPE
jgi:hypothetical protein